MTKHVFNSDASVPEPSFLTSIILPTFNEVNYLEPTLMSLQAQNVMLAYPDKFELLIIDSQSTDGTFDLVKKYAGTLLQVEGPKGKLTARHLATQQAKGDVIVSVDADTTYPPPNWLNLILRYFNNPEVVGVSSPRLQQFPCTFNSIPIAITDSLFRSMRGSNCAYRKQAYFEIGGFDLTINQFKLNEIVLEEEIRFQRRLRQLGKIIYDWQAPVFTSNRRFTGYDQLFQQQVAEGQRF